MFTGFGLVVDIELVVADGFRWLRVIGYGCSDSTAGSMCGVGTGFVCVLNWLRLR